MDKLFMRVKSCPLNLQYKYSVKNIFIKITKLFSARWRFLPPNEKETVFYDVEKSIDLKKYFNKNSYQFLYTRYEEINFFIILISVFDKLKNKSNSFSFNYFKNFIKYSKAKYVISFNTLDLNFWYLKKSLKKTQFILIQNNNSITSPREQKIIKDKLLLKNLNKKGYLDYIFMFGEKMKKHFAKFIKCKSPIVTGSYLNNLVINKNFRLGKEIIYISQYRDFGSFKIADKLNNKNLMMNILYNNDKLILNFLSNYCKKNNFNLFILTKQSANINIKNSKIKEKKYFEKILKSSKFKFLTPGNLKSTYNILNKYRNFVTVNSNLGFEALSRGNRVAFMSIRYKASGIYKNEGFGDVYHNLKKGPFWTDDIKKKELERVLNSSIKTSNKKWKIIKEKFVDPIIKYDFDNSILIKKFKKIGINL